VLVWEDGANSPERARRVRLKRVDPKSESKDRQESFNLIAEQSAQMTAKSSSGAAVAVSQPPRSGCRALKPTQLPHVTHREPESAQFGGAALPASGQGMP
jgi:hypothetical protein